MTRKPTQPKWSEVKRRIADWEPRELVGLVKDLFEASPENRRFLAARLLQDDRGPALLEPYLKRIRQAFYTRSGMPQVRLGLADALKVIRESRKATDDQAGTAELLLTFIETGTEFTLEFGDVDERFYESLGATLEDLHKVLRANGCALHGRFRERLRELAERAEPIGWGYGDHVTDVVAALDAKATKSR